MKFGMKDLCGLVIGGLVIAGSVYVGYKNEQLRKKENNENKVVRDVVTVSCAVVAVTTACFMGHYLFDKLSLDSRELKQKIKIMEMEAKDASVSRAAELVAKNREIELNALPESDKLSYILNEKKLIENEAIRAHEITLAKIEAQARIDIAATKYEMVGEALNEYTEVLKTSETRKEASNIINILMKDEA